MEQLREVMCKKCGQKEDSMLKVGVEQVKCRFCANMVDIGWEEE